jgi:hypothetical protein
MQSSLEGVKETSPKNGIVGVEHVNNIKSDVIHAGVLWGAEQQW